MYKSYKSYGMYYLKLNYVLCNVSNWCIFADDNVASLEPWDNISNGIMIGILCLVEYERNHSSTHKDIRFER